MLACFCVLVAFVCLYDHLPILFVCDSVCRNLGGIIQFVSLYVVHLCVLSVLHCMCPSFVFLNLAVCLSLYVCLCM